MPSKRAKYSPKTPFFMRYSEICLIGGCLICGAYQQRNKEKKVGTFQIMPWCEGCLISGCALVKLDCNCVHKSKIFVNTLMIFMQWGARVLFAHGWKDRFIENSKKKERERKNTANSTKFAKNLEKKGDVWKKGDVHQKKLRERSWKYGNYVILSLFA